MGVPNKLTFNIYKFSNLLFLFIAIILLLIVPILQLHIKYIGHIGIGGVFIDDTESYWNNLRNFSNEHDNFTKFTTILGVLIIYYPVLYFGSIYCYFLNLIILYASLKIFLKTLRFMKINLTEIQIILLFILIFTNFYIWGVLFYPNKEIPLIFLTNIFVFLFLRKKYLINFLLFLIIFFFRDGFSFILFSAIIIYLFFQKIYIKNPIKFLIYIILFLMFFSLKAFSEYGLLSDYQYVIDRNIDQENKEKFAYNLPYFIQYIINLINNGIGYSFRAQFIDFNKRLYIHGIGLWQFSTIIFIGLICWIKMLIENHSTNIKKVFFLIFVSLLFMATSSYPQPRYMFPFIFWLILAIVIKLNYKNLVLIFTTIFIIAFLLSLTSFGLDFPVGIDIDNYSNSYFK